jgi:hypothetical protein
MPGMTPPAPTTQLYKRHRFPAEIISHCVWLYFRFSLSYRDVEEMRLERECSNHMKPYAIGVANSVSRMPTSCVAGALDRVTSGTWPRRF